MGIYDGLKDAAKILKEAGKIEQYREILDALEKMLEMQNKINELQTENIDLKNKLEIQKKLTYRNNAYWTQDENQGPFCSRCWDSEKKLIRMQPRNTPEYFDCPNCPNKTVKIYASGHAPPRVHPLNPGR